MADIQDNHSPEEPTRRVADFPEVKGKIVNAVEVHADHEYYGITICFQDETTLSFTVEPCVVAFPVYAGWENGEEKTIKKYKPVRSKIQRT